MLRSRFIVDSGTTLCCLLGDPVSQSPSPGMHNSGFRSINLNFIYLSFRVSEKELKNAIEGLKTLGARGFNITIPHKEAALKYVDRIDTISTDIGAINTVVNDDGELFGVNTDVEGFINPLKDNDIPLKNKKCLILGAGGAARSCITGLVHEDCTDFVILNRHPERANQMTSYLKKKIDFDVNIDMMNRSNLDKNISDSDLVINTTPIGMYPHVGISPIPKILLREDLLVYDIVYKPVKTKLIEYAEMAGAKVIHGYEMLVSQAAGSFSLWTGSKAPMGVMRRTALQILGV